MSLRIRRLENERKLLQHAFAGHPHVSVRSTLGDPPEQYAVTYMIKGLQRMADGTLVIRTNHEIEVSLPAEYPRLPAACRMVTPVFHPNIDLSTVCTSDFHAAQETLVDLIVRVGQMIAFQRHNVKSPLNAEAARWCEQNLSRLPVDGSDLHPVERSR
jgi:ubiquitin-protein ligase